MEEILITIVVPVYKVEKLLKRCVESILGQTYRNFELILVDDGSPDMCPYLCDEYAKQDPRIKVIHKTNGGLSDARNFGIDIASGKLITFIDSDDYVAEDYLEVLYQLLNKYGADISICLFKSFSDERVATMTQKESFKEYVFNGEEAIIDLCYQKHIPNSAWGKLYKTELFKEIRYPVGKLYEDLGTTYKLFLLSDKIVLNTAKKYYYFQRLDSIMHFEFSKRNMDRVFLAEQLYEDVKNISSQLEKAATCRMFVSNIQVLRELPYDKEQFKFEDNQIQQNIILYRKKVLFDKNAKYIIRLIALFTYLDKRFLQKLGKVYKLIYH